MAGPLLLLPNGGLSNLCSENEVDEVWRLGVAPRAYSTSTDELLEEERFEAEEVALYAHGRAGSASDGARSLGRAESLLNRAEIAAAKPSCPLSMSNCCQRILFVAGMIRESLIKKGVWQAPPLPDLEHVLKGVSFMSMADAHVSVTGVNALEAAYATWHTMPDPERFQLATQLIAAMTSSSCQLQPLSLAWPLSSGRITDLLDDTVCGLLELVAEDQALSTLQRVCAVQCLIRISIARAQPRKLLRLMALLTQTTAGVAAAKLHADMVDSYTDLARYAAAAELFPNFEPKRTAIHVDPLGLSSPARLLPSKPRRTRVSQPSTSRTSAGAARETSPQQPLAQDQGISASHVVSPQSTQAAVPTSAVPPIELLQSSPSPTQVKVAGISRLRARPRTAAAVVSVAAPAEQIISIQGPRASALLGSASESAHQPKRPGSSSSVFQSSQKPDTSAASNLRTGSSAATHSSMDANDTTDCPLLLPHFDSARLLVQACLCFLTAAQGNDVCSRLPAAAEHVLSPKASPYSEGYADWLISCFLEHTCRAAELCLSAEQKADLPFALRTSTAPLTDDSSLTTAADVTAGRHAFTLPLALGDLSSSMRAVSDRPIPNEQKMQLLGAGQNTFNELCQENNAFEPEASFVRCSHLERVGIVSYGAGNEHTILLTEMGQVLTVGYNASGACGRGDRSPHTDLQPAALPADYGSPVDVYAANGCEHSFILTDQGAVFACGNNKHGQLGLGEASEETCEQYVVQFSRVSSLGKSRVRMIGLSYKHSVFVTDDGIFACGKASCFGGSKLQAEEVVVPVRLSLSAIDPGTSAKLDTMHPTVVSIACGQEHTALVLSDGSLWTAGSNQFGQTGHPCQPGSVAPPGFSRVTSGAFEDPDFLAATVVCGYFHTLVLSRSGRLVSCGRNDYGQTGHGAGVSAQFTFASVSSPETFVTISAGCYHSFAIDNAGQLYGFGRNQHGQLFMATKGDVFLPTLCSDVRFDQGGQLVCGFYHSLALVPQASLSSQTRASNPLYSQSITMLVASGAQQALVTSPSVRPGKHPPRPRRDQARLRSSGAGVLLQASGCDWHCAPLASVMASLSLFLSELSSREQAAVRTHKCAKPTLDTDSTTKKLDAFIPPGGLLSNLSNQSLWPTGAVASAVTALLTCAAVNSSRFRTAAGPTGWKEHNVFHQPQALNSISQYSQVLTACHSLSTQTDAESSCPSIFSDVLSNQHCTFTQTKLVDFFVISYASIIRLSSGADWISRETVTQLLSLITLPTEDAEAAIGRVNLLASLLARNEFSEDRWTWLVQLLSNALDQRVESSLLNHARSWCAPEPSVLPAVLDSVVSSAERGVDSAWELLACIVCRCEKSGTPLNNLIKVSCGALKSAGSELAKRWTDIWLLLFTAQSKQILQSRAVEILTFAAAYPPDDSLMSMKQLALARAISGSITSFKIKSELTEPNWQLAGHREPIELYLDASTKPCAVAAFIGAPPSVLQPAIQTASDRFDLLWKSLVQHEARSNILFKVFSEKLSHAPISAGPAFVGEAFLLDPVLFLDFFSSSPNFEPEEIVSWCSPNGSHSGEGSCYGFHQLACAFSTSLRCIFLHEIRESNLGWLLTDALLGVGRKDARPKTKLQKIFKSATTLLLQVWRLQSSFPTSSNSDTAGSWSAILCQWARRLQVHTLHISVQAQSTYTPGHKFWRRIRNCLKFVAALKHSRAAGGEPKAEPYQLSGQTVAHVKQTLERSIPDRSLESDDIFEHQREAIKQWAESLSSRGLQAIFRPTATTASEKHFSHDGCSNCLWTLMTSCEVTCDAKLAVLLTVMEANAAISGGLNDLRLIHFCLGLLGSAPTLEDTNTNESKVLTLGRLKCFLVRLLLRRRLRHLPQRLLSLFLAKGETAVAGHSGPKLPAIFSALLALAAVRSVPTLDSCALTCIAERFQQDLESVGPTLDEQDDRQLLQSSSTNSPQLVNSFTMDNASLVCQLLCESRVALAVNTAATAGEIPAASVPPQEFALENLVGTGWQLRAWVYTHSEPNGRSKVILCRGSSAAFACPLVLLRADGLVEVALATDQHPHDASSEWQHAFKSLGQVALGHTAESQLGELAQSRSDGLLWSAVKSDTKLLPHRWHLLEVDVVPNLANVETLVSLQLDSGSRVSCVVPGLPRPALTCNAARFEPQEPPVVYSSILDSKRILPDSIIEPEHIQESSGTQPFSCWANCFTYSASEGCCSDPCSFDTDLKAPPINAFAGFDGQFLSASSNEEDGDQYFPPERPIPSELHWLGIAMIESLSKVPQFDDTLFVRILQTISCKPGGCLLQLCRVLVRLLLRVVSGSGNPEGLLQCGLSVMPEASSQTNSAAKVCIDWLFEFFGVVGSMKALSAPIFNQNAPPPNVSECLARCVASSTEKRDQEQLSDVMPFSTQLFEFMERLVGPHSDQMTRANVLSAVQDELQAHVRLLAQQSDFADHIIQRANELTKEILFDQVRLFAECDDPRTFGDVGIGVAAEVPEEQDIKRVAFNCHSIRLLIGASTGPLPQLSAGQLVALPGSTVSSLHGVLRSQWSAISDSQAQDVATVVKVCHLHDTVLLYTDAHGGVYTSTRGWSMPGTVAAGTVAASESHPQQPQHKNLPTISLAQNQSHLQQNNCNCCLGISQRARGRELESVLALRLANQKRISHDDKSLVWAPKASLKSAVNASIALAPNQYHCRLAQVFSASRTHLYSASQSCHTNRGMAALEAALALQCVRNEALELCRQYICESLPFDEEISPASLSRISSPVYLDSVEVRLHARALRLRIMQLGSNSTYTRITAAVFALRDQFSRSAAVAVEQQRVQSALRALSSNSQKTALPSAEAPPSMLVMQDFTADELGKANLLVAVLGFAPSELAPLPSKRQLQPLLEMGFQLHWCMVAAQLCQHDLTLSSTWLLDNSQFLHAIQEQLDQDASSEHSGGSQLDTEAEQDDDSEQDEIEREDSVATDESEHVEADSASSASSAADSYEPDDEHQSEAISRAWQLAQQAQLATDEENAHASASAADPLESLLRALHSLGAENDGGSAAALQTPPRSQRQTSAARSPLSPLSPMSSTTWDDAQSDYGHFSFDAAGNLVAVASPSRAETHLGSGDGAGVVSPVRAELIASDTMRDLCIQVPMNVAAICFVRLVSKAVKAASVRALETDVSSLGNDLSQSAHSGQGTPPVDLSGSFLQTAQPVLESSMSASTPSRPRSASEPAAVTDAGPQYSPDAATDYSAAGSALDIVRRRRQAPQTHSAAESTPGGAASGGSTFASSSNPPAPTMPHENPFLRALQEDIDRLLPRLSQARERLAALGSAPLSSNLNAPRLRINTAPDILLKLDSAQRLSFVVYLGSHEIELVPPVAPLSGSAQSSEQPGPFDESSAWQLALKYNLGNSYAGVTHRSAKLEWSDSSVVAHALHARTWGVDCASEHRASHFPPPSGAVLRKTNMFSCKLTASQVLDEDHFPLDRLHALVPSMESNLYFQSGKSRGTWDAYGQRLFDADPRKLANGTAFEGFIDPVLPPWIPGPAPVSLDVCNGLALNSLVRSTELSMALQLQTLLVQVDNRPLAVKTVPFMDKLGGDSPGLVGRHLLGFFTTQARPSAKCLDAQTVGMGTMEDASKPFFPNIVGEDDYWEELPLLLASLENRDDWRAEQSARADSYLARMADLLALPAEDLASHDLYAAAAATESMLTVLASRDLVILRRSGSDAGRSDNGSQATLAYQPLSLWMNLKSQLLRNTGFSAIGLPESSISTSCILLGNKKHSIPDLLSAKTWLFYTHSFHRQTVGQNILHSLLSGAVKGQTTGFHVSLATQLLCGALLELKAATQNAEFVHKPFGRRTFTTADNQAIMLGNVELSDWAMSILDIAFSKWLSEHFEELAAEQVLAGVLNRSGPGELDLETDASPIYLMSSSFIAEELIELLAFPNTSFRFLILRNIDAVCQRLELALRSILKKAQADATFISPTHTKALDELSNRLELLPFLERMLRLRLTAEPWNGRMYFTPLVHCILNLISQQNRLHSIIREIISVTGALEIPSKTEDETLTTIAPAVHDSDSSSLSLSFQGCKQNEFIQLQVRRAVALAPTSSTFPSVAVSTIDSCHVVLGKLREVSSTQASTQEHLLKVHEILSATNFTVEPFHMIVLCQGMVPESLSPVQLREVHTLHSALSPISLRWKAAVQDIYGMYSTLPVSITSVQNTLCSTSPPASAFSNWKLAEVAWLRQSAFHVPMFRDVESMLQCETEFVALWTAAHILSGAAASIYALLGGFPIQIDSISDFSGAAAAGASSNCDKAALQCVWAIKQFLTSVNRKVVEVGPHLFSTGPIEGRNTHFSTDRPLADFLSVESLWRTVAISDCKSHHVHRLCPSTTFLLRSRRVRLSSGSSTFRASDWSDPVAIRTASPPGFTWDVQPTLMPRPPLLQSSSVGSLVSGTMSVSVDGLSVSHTASETWSMVTGTVGFSTGINRWSIRIDRTPTAYLFIGVARITANPQVFLGGDEHGWGFLGDRALYHGRSKSRTYGKRFGVQDVIGCELNCDEGTLSFSLNGTPLGIAFRNLTGVLYPAVSFYNHGQKVTLIQQPAIDLVPQEEGSLVSSGIAGTESDVISPAVSVDLRLLASPHVYAMHCPGAAAGAHILGTPIYSVRTRLLTRISEILAVMCGQGAVSWAFVHFVATSCKAALDFAAGNLNRCSTASGFDVLLSCSKSALQLFGVGFKDKIMCKLGECVVEGVRDGRLWVRPVDSPFVWFLAQHQVEGGLAVTPDVLTYGLSKMSGAKVGNAGDGALLAEARGMLLWPSTAGDQTTLANAAAQQQHNLRADVQSTESQLVEAPASFALVAPPAIVRVAEAAPAARDGAERDSEHDSALQSTWACNADKRSEFGLILLQSSEQISGAEETASNLGVCAHKFLAINGVGPMLTGSGLVHISCVLEVWRRSSFDLVLVQTLMSFAQGLGLSDPSKLSPTQLQQAVQQPVLFNSAAKIMTNLVSHFESEVCQNTDVNRQEILRVMRTVTGEEVCIYRALFLVHLNDCLAPCMPALNMRARPRWKGSLKKEILQLSELPEGGSTFEHAASWCAVGHLTALRDLGQCDPFALIQHCEALKGKIFPRIKQQVLTTVLNRTNLQPQRMDDEFEHPTELPKVIVDRPGAKRALQSSDVEQRTVGSVFGQLMRSLAWVPTAYLRLGHAHPMDDNQLRAFYVAFLGEGVDDYGGAYREVFTQAVAELQAVVPDSVHSALPVFQQSPNAVSGLGSNRGWFIPACGQPHSQRVANSQYEFSLPELVLNPLQSSACRFTGSLLGMAIRCQILLDLHLSASTWRLLAQDPVETESIPSCVLDCMSALPEMGLQDGSREPPVWLLSLTELRSIDHSAASLLDQLLRLYDQKVQSGDDLNEEVALFPDLMFSTYLSSGQQVPLTAGGLQRDLRVQDIPRFVLFTLAARALEGREAILQMRTGLADVVSEALLPLMTGAELQKLLCGAEDFDVELLQRNTEYEDGLDAEDDHVKFLWEALRSMSSSQRAAFLRFVWARARLPSTDAGFTQKFKLQKLEPAVEDCELSPDDLQQRRDALLPKSSTCFGALYLPRYSSAQVMLARLNYAAENCISMDADFATGLDESANW